MKVILLEDLKGIGRKYDVKDVSDGYARNFLLPKKLVKPATPQALKELEQLKLKLAREDMEFKKHLSALARKINESFLEFRLKTAKNGSVFGSITKEMILRAMREHGWLGKERIDLALEHPIKEFGEHKISIDLKKGIKAELKIIVQPQE
jgi:large subunit ribosomal protein L9